MVTDEPGPDILVHINVLRNFGQSSITEGAIVELMAQTSERGLQATEILQVEMPEDDLVGVVAYSFREDDSQGVAELAPARVKWFDKQRGFGFVNVFGFSEDIFVHMEVLRNSGLSDLQAGEAISVLVASGPRGKLVAEIRPWDATMPSME